MVSPGTERSHDSPVCECCAAKRSPAPPMARMTSGALTLPPDMKRCLAIELTIWSKQTPRKSANMISAIGRYPVMARPSAAPTKPVSAIGEGVVETCDGSITADLVVLGLGVEPNAAIGVDAGLDSGPEGAIHVNRRQQTSHDAVWAGGDCTDVHHLVTAEPTYIALGTVANRAGRVAGINLGGG